MSEMDVAKMMFGWANESGTGMLGTASYGSNVRYGTVVADNGDGTYDVRLDTGEVITMKSDVPLSVGDTVQIVNQGGSYVLYGMETFVGQTQSRHQQLAEQIEKQGEEILASAKADLDEVNASFEEFKATHTLTDADIQKTVEESVSATVTTFEGMIQDLDGTYVTEAEFKQGLDEFSSTFGEEYVSASDLGEMEKSLQSQIAQNAEAIRTEVSDRTAAVSGALEEAKSYTDQQAESITSTVEQSVTNSLGDTYATKTELQQTSTSLSASISGAVSTANSANSTANSADSKATTAKNFIDTHFEATTKGLVISSSASSYKTRMSPNSFDILDKNDTEIISIDVNYGTPRIIAAMDAPISIVGLAAWGSLNVGPTSVDINGSDSFYLRRVGNVTGMYYAWTSIKSSGSTGTVTLSSNISNFSMLMIVYEGSTGYQHSAFVRVSSSTVYASLICTHYTYGPVAEVKNVTISGTTITVYRGGRSYIGDGGTNVNSAESTSYISITAVYGLTV